MNQDHRSGVVEGLTEFLPISRRTSTHRHRLLNFGDRWRHIRDLIQLGAVVAVVAFYAADLLQQPAPSHDPSFAASGCWSCWHFYGAVAGFLLRDFIHDCCLRALAIAWTLIGGIVMIVAEVVPRRQPTTHVLAYSLAASAGRRLRAGAGVGAGRLSARAPRRRRFATRYGSLDATPLVLPGYFNPRRGHPVRLYKILRLLNGTDAGYLPGRTVVARHHRGHQHPLATAL